MEVGIGKVGEVESVKTLISFLTKQERLESRRNVGFLGGSSIVKF